MALQQAKRQVHRKKAIKDRVRRRHEYFLPGTRYRCSICHRLYGWRRFRQSPLNRLVCDRCMKEREA